MKTYRDIDTGEIWTEEEIHLAFAAFRHEMKDYDSFEDYLDTQLAAGRAGTGGLVEV